jgi:TolA-binding protein
MRLRLSCSSFVSHNREVGLCKVFIKGFWGGLILQAALVGAAEKLDSKADAERDFARAEDLFKAGQEDAAIVSLSDFLRRHPSSALADDAQYLLGEIEFRRRNFSDAIRELKKTLEYRKHGGDRVADAYFMVGESWFRLGDREKARIEWEALRRAYPKSSAAERASMRLMELDAEAAGGAQRE